MIGLRITYLEKAVRCILGPETILWYGSDLIHGIAGLTNTNVALSFRFPNQTLLRLKDVIPGSRYPQTFLLSHKQAESLLDTPIRTFFENLEKQGVGLVDFWLFEKNCVMRNWKGLIFQNAILGGYNLQSIWECANRFPETVIPEPTMIEEGMEEEANQSESANIPAIVSIAPFVPISHMRREPPTYHHICTDGRRYLVKPQRTTPTTLVDIHPYIATYNGFYYIYSARED